MQDGNEENIEAAYMTAYPMWDDDYDHLRLVFGTPDLEAHLALTPGSAAVDTIIKGLRATLAELPDVVQTAWFEGRAAVEVPGDVLRRVGINEGSVLLFTCTEDAVETTTRSGVTLH